MKTMRLLMMLVAATGLTATSAFAAKPAPVETADVDETAIGGEAFVRMKLDFVKFTLDGKEWENHEYVDGRKTLVIRGVERSGEHTVLLTPREPGWEPYTLLLKPDEFKRTKVAQKGKATVIAFRANHKVEFTKAAAPAPKPAESGK